MLVSMMTKDNLASSVMEKLERETDFG